MTKNNVDGVYSADPLKDPQAKKLDKVTHFEALNMRLQVMDATALSLCLENRLPIIVFDLQAPHSIERAVSGEPIGTLVYSDRKMVSDMVSDVLRSVEEKMRSSMDLLKRELATIRTGHATPALIEHIKVEYAGVSTPLNQIAGISAPAARLLVIQPWDRGSIHSIEKAILKSDIGLTPNSDGSVIRLNIPLLSEERRLELTKLVGKRVEERKVVIRNLRREAMEELKGLEKKKEISQDELKRTLDQLQKLTDSFIADAEQIGRDKEAELMEV